MRALGNMTTTIINSYHKSQNLSSIKAQQTNWQKLGIQSVK